MNSFIKPSEASGFYQGVNVDDALHVLKRRVEQLEEAVTRIADSMHDLAKAVKDLQERIERVEKGWRRTI